jgi:hypothetical protein
LNLTFFLNWKGSRWEIIKTFFGKLSKNWACEFNLYATHSFIMIDARLVPQGDHRGIFVMLGVLGWALDFNIYDTRHAGN